MHENEMRRCLVECDIVGLRRLWSHINPHLPMPTTDQEFLTAIHMARTSSKAIPFRQRAYSHRWLTDEGYPSLLPDELRPKAERVYPITVDAVGISCTATSMFMKPIVPFVREAMEDVVKDAYANGDKDPMLIKSRMLEARVATVRKLTGIILEAVR